jgi:hypothetical protein
MPLSLPTEDSWVCARGEIDRGEESGLHSLFGNAAVGEGKGDWGECYPIGEGAGFEAG